jgi:two-component system OmpR family response regulator
MAGLSHGSQRPSTASEGPSLSGLPTLIVDADTEAATQLAGQLHHAGFDSYVAGDGSAACLAIQSQYFRSLIVVADLSDLRSAYQVRELRTFAPRSWLLVVGPRGDQAAVDRVHRCGGDDLISTPFTMARLTAQLVEYSRRPRLSL